MAWNGSGTFSRTNGTHNGTTVWTQDKNAAAKILASRHDNHDQDLADGINNCLTKDGQNAMTANLNMGGNNLVNVDTITATVATITIDDNTEIDGTLDVTGAVTFDTTLAVTGAATLSSTLGVTGAATLNSTLAVTGAITATGAINANGGITAAGTLNMGSNAISNVSTITASHVNSTNLSATSATVSSISTTTSITADGGGCSMSGGFTFGSLSTHSSGINTPSINAASSDPLTIGDDITIGGDANITGALRVDTYTPASASDQGAEGTIAWDSNYIYICVADDTWKRVAIATW